MDDGEIRKRRAWFNWYSEKRTNGTLRGDGEAGPPFRCPCCHCRTLSGRGGFEICPVCFWEDDGQDGRDADVVRGGPNGRLSLTAARQNYLRHGACDPRFLSNVRPPRAEETDTEYHI